MRKIIATLRVSVDGFVEGPNGELDWAMAEDEETWKDVFEMLAHVDTLILGRSNNNIDTMSTGERALLITHISQGAV